MLFRSNTTGGAVDTSVVVGGRTVRIAFSADESDHGDVFEISASGLSLDIGGFVTIEGSITFNGDSFAGDNLEIFLGRGPARLANGSLNPLAVGVLLTGARIGLIRVAGASDTFALWATGTVQVKIREQVGEYLLLAHDTAKLTNEVEFVDLKSVRHAAKALGAPAA